VDLYTFNFGYIGTRTTGKGAGRYLVADPQWKGATPPGIIWSITIYIEDQFMFDNPIYRYSIGDRTTGLITGLDGSLEIYIQKSQPPADKISNWLPAPEGSFSLTMRMYMPQSSELAPVLYAPPAVVKQE
jgi:hypothetical protein